MATVLQTLDKRTVFGQNSGVSNSSKIIINKPQTPVLFKIAEKDKTSISECIDKYGKIIWGIARIFANSTKEAEKLTCEIFSELWKSAETFDGDKMDDKKFILMIALKCVNRSRQNFI